MQSILGLAAIMIIAWCMSENRRRMPWRIIGSGLALQFGFALVLLKLPLVNQAFLALNQAVLAIETATREGTSFVFGYLGGGPLPFSEPYPGASFVLATQALPLVIVISALSALLFHWRIMPVIVRGFAALLQKTMGIGGALGVGISANIFVGMIEAPVFVRPYLERMSRSEIFMLMTGGMATIAGTVMVLYASFLRDVIPGAMGHILTASIISAPAALLVAGIMVPETGNTVEEKWTPPKEAANTMDAIAHGTATGVNLFIHIVGMLLVLVALVALANAILGVLPDVAGAPLTLQRILGVVLSPVAWLMGIPWAEAQTAGSLLGTKVVLNELLAYLDMSKLPADALSERSRIILVYALCGFANFGSLGIMIGGFGTLVPERRAEVAALGLKSIAAGFLATCMTGTVIGLLY